jgi:hypothetical protein
MLQHLSWCSLEDSGKDDRLVMMYKIANENVAISNQDTRMTPWRQFEICIHRRSLSPLHYPY